MINEVIWKLTLDTAVASACRLVLICDRLLLIGEGTGDILCLCDLDLGWNPLSGAVDYVAVLNETLDHPVAIAGAVNA